MPARASAAGADEIVVQPCFLFDGNHIRRDVPALLAAGWALQDTGAAVGLVPGEFRGADGAGDGVEDIVCDWENQGLAFSETRQEYLLYP